MLFFKLNYSAIKLGIHIYDLDLEKSFCEVNLNTFLLTENFNDSLLFDFVIFLN